MAATIFPLTMDDAIVDLVVSRQSGTREKAIQEAIQNGYDARCSAMYLTITATGFMIVNDGRTIGEDNDGGRLSEEEAVHRNMGRLGAEHKPGDAPIGEMRIGRAQLLYVADVAWTSGWYRIPFSRHAVAGTTRYRYEYHLERQQAFLQGCRLEGTWRTPLSANELQWLLTAVGECCAYVDTPIFINGEQVNTPPETVAWDVTHEDYYLRTAEEGGLSIYNRGFKVCRLDGSIAGHGVLVSRQRFRLNMARATIDEACPMWRSIRSSLRRRLAQTSGARQTLDDSARQCLIDQLLAGEVDCDEIREARLLVDVQGRGHAIEILERHRLLAVAPLYHALGDTIHTRRIAFVLADTTLAAFHVATPEELLATLQRVDLGGRYTYSLRSISVRSLDQLTRGLADGGAILRPRDLSQQQQLLLNAINQVQHLLVNFMNDSGHLDAPRAVRAIRAGRSDTRHAWTDGETWITLNIERLQWALDHGLSGFLLLARLLVHEYLHDDENCDLAAHTPEFYDRYHAIITSGVAPRARTLGWFAERMMRQYSERLRHATRRITGAGYVDTE